MKHFLHHGDMQMAMQAAMPPDNASLTYTLVLGLAYGVMHIIGPDHLGTLMSLSAAASPRQAFSVGAAWSLGHCGGMVAVALLVMALKKLAQVNVESWEHIGDYIIGLSLVLCGLYFILREEKFVQESEDGSVTLKACECCEPALEATPATTGGGGEYGSMPKSTNKRRASLGPGRLHVCSNFTSARSRGCCSGGDCEDHDLPPAVPGMAGAGGPIKPAPEALASPQAKKKSQKQETTGYGFAASLLGVFQGMCCPMGLVGISFVASLPPTGVFVFLLAFLTVSALGTGTIAALWAALLSAEVCSPGSTKAMYRASCYFTLLLGLAWIAANACGMLDQLNYAEGSHAFRLPNVQDGVANSSDAAATAVVGAH